MRNAIERIFGILKRRFKILQTAPEYPIHSQAALIYALTALHNFIKIHDARDEALDFDAEVETGGAERPPGDREDNIIFGEEMELLLQKRDYIAQSMWNDYQAYQIRVGRRQ